MKNKKVIIIVLGVILIVLSNFISISIYKNKDSKIDIQLTNQSWLIYDESIKGIKNNMDQITVPNEDFFWWGLKDFDIEDDKYESILNSLVADVRMCYIEYTDDGSFYTGTNPIRKYRDSRFITKKELAYLNFDMYHEVGNGCLTRFEKYNNLVISNDEELRSKVLNKTNAISLIKTTELFKNQDASYNELLLRKSMEVQIIKEISDFLVEEYNRLK